MLKLVKVVLKGIIEVDSFKTYMIIMIVLAKICVLRDSCIFKTQALEKDVACVTISDKTHVLCVYLESYSR